MEILAVTLIVFTILVVSYILFSRDAKEKKREEFEKNVLLRDFYKQAMEHVETLPLAGTGSDENSDFAFKQAVKKIRLSDDIRVQIYD